MSNLTQKTLARNTQLNLPAKTLLPSLFTSNFLNTTKINIKTTLANANVLPTVSQVKDNKGGGSLPLAFANPGFAFFQRVHNTSPSSGARLFVGALLGLTIGGFAGLALNRALCSFAPKLAKIYGGALVVTTSVAGMLGGSYAAQKTDVLNSK